MCGAMDTKINNPRPRAARTARSFPALAAHSAEQALALISAGVPLTARVGWVQLGSGVVPQAGALKFQPSLFACLRR